jgi:hypothetical protein
MRCVLGWTRLSAMQFYETGRLIFDATIDHPPLRGALTIHRHVVKEMQPSGQTCLRRQVKLRVLPRELVCQPVRSRGSTAGRGGALLSALRRGAR